jgi:predicted amidophosphoribosyltransferase
MISRVTAVKKSAFQIASERPTLQDHFDSFSVQVLTPAPTHIVVIDDVITAGTTMLAAAMRVALAYPNAQVRGFAIVRTESSGDITSFQDPTVGTVKPRGLRAVRRP